MDAAQENSFPNKQVSDIIALFQNTTMLILLVYEVSHFIIQFFRRVTTEDREYRCDKCFLS
jgi:hypothetical protein